MCFHTTSLHSGRPGWLRRLQAECRHLHLEGHCPLPPIPVIARISAWLGGSTVKRPFKGAVYGGDRLRNLEHH